MFEEFRHTCVLYTASCDMRGWWKLSSMLETMQSTADRHNEMLECGRYDLSKKGLTWVLFKTVLQIKRYPRLGERITVRTFTKAPRMHFIPRYYELIDGDDKIIGCAGSFWTLCDIKTKKHVSLREMPVHISENSDYEAPVNLLLRPQSIDGQTVSAEHISNCCDIDCNGHVNNTRYVDWLYNALGYEVMRDYVFGSLIIEYYREVKPDCILRNTVIRSGEGVNFNGCESDKLCFCVSGNLVDRESFAGI